MENQDEDIDSINDETVDTTIVSDNIPTLEDYQALTKSNKELYARAKKAEGFELKDGKWTKKDAPIKTNPLNKPNEQSFTRDEALLIAQGHTIEEVDLALKISKTNGVPIAEAVKDDYFSFKVQERKQKDLSEKASLGASNINSIKVDKPIETMDDREHKDLFEKALAG